jgi:TCP-1/cpn60 chaperonin family
MDMLALFALVMRPSSTDQVGDGTTTVVILAGEFLREAKPYIEEGVHPRVWMLQTCACAVCVLWLMLLVVSEYHHKLPNGRCQGS